MQPEERENLPAVRDVTKKDVQSAKNRQQIYSIERQGKIGAWNDYIGFVISKGLGLAGLIGGGLELLDPSILTITLPYPALVAGAGLALLTGKNIITLIAKVEKIMGGS